MNRAMDLSVVVVQQVSDEISGFKIGLVAGGDDVGVPDSPSDCPGQEGAKSGGAALADESYVSALQLRS